MKVNWICSKSCYEELKNLSSLPVKLLIYRNKEWNKLLKVASSDESINKKIKNNRSIQEINNILNIYHKH